MTDISDQSSIKRMLGSISQRRGGIVSASTKRTFFFYIKRFCEFCGKTPDELIEDRMRDWESKDIFTKRRHEEKLIEFAQHLREEGYTSNTVSTAVGAVRSFYRTNYHPMIEVNVPSGKPVRVYKVPTKEELAQVIDMARVPWHRAFMMLTKDCGISLQDMLALKLIDGSPTYGSIKDQIRKGRVPIHIHVVREKTKYKYDTFLGEDSFELLNNDAIFPDLASKSTSHDKRLLPYSDSTIQDAMKAIGGELGWSHFTPYSLRKWFRTQLTLANVNDALIETWMGHSLGKVRGAYLVPPAEGQMKVYSENYDALKL